MKTFKKLGKIIGLTLAILFSISTLITAPNKITAIIFIIAIWVIVSFTIKIWVPLTRWFNDSNKTFVQHLLEHNQNKKQTKEPNPQPATTLTPDETNTFNQIINQLKNDNPDRNNT